MNLPRTTDQARDQLHEAVKTATPIQILMFLVILQAVQIIQYVQNVQKSLPTSRKSLPPLDPTTNLPFAEASTCTDPVLGDEDSLGERFAEEFWRLVRENPEQRPWTISNGNRMVAGMFDNPGPPLPATISFRDIDADNPRVAAYDPTLLGQDMDGNERLQMGGYTRDSRFRSTMPIMWPGPNTLDEEREAVFKKRFPDAEFTPENYQYALDWSENVLHGNNHKLTTDRVEGRGFRMEARYNEYVFGDGKYTIAGMPADQYREMNHRASGYCTPCREMFTNGPQEYAAWLR